MAFPTVLLIDDDAGFRSELSDYLRSNGFDSLVFGDFGDAIEFLDSSRGFSVVIAELTVGLRHLFDCIPRITHTRAASLLVLSHHSEATEKIVALELGADDFMPKTIERREILARIRAAARRSAAQQTAPQSAPAGGAAPGSWQFLRDKRELIDPDGNLVRLTTAEFSLLNAFVENTGSPLTRDHLSMIALGRHYSANDRSVDNLVAKLRRKLRDSATLARMIKTARPVGYVFTGFTSAIAARSGQTQVPQTEPATSTE